MKYNILLGVLCILPLTKLKAQGDDFSDKPYLNKISIPPPGVSGLAKFTDVPVSLYTGSPNISIPIYTINTGTFSWPVSLDYNASGIRVTENASNVGLGWTLRAEGAIIQNVLGVSDNGSYQANGLNWDNAAILPNNSADYTLMESLSNQSIDGVPDLYLYNFNGHSGKFIMADEIKLLPKANLQVTSWQDGTQKYWKIVAEDGTKYFFEAVETTLTRSGASSSPSQSWYLTKAVDANNNDSLIFEYENTSMDMGMGKSYEITNWNDNYALGNWSVDMAPNDVPIPGLMSQYTLTTTGKQLKRILFSNGSVEYDIVWNNRQDLATTGSAYLNVPRVTNILVKDKEGNVIKTAHLEQDYFGPANGGVDDKRLRLKGVTFASTVSAATNTPDQKYSFEYNDTELPSKSSNSIDHWGYYNGANNATLIPSLNYYGQFNYYGANRGTHATYVKAGILEKVNYPTGGYARFVWEAHQETTYVPPGLQMIKTDSLTTAQVIGQGTGWTPSTEESDGWYSIPDNDTFDGLKGIITVTAGYPQGATNYEVSQAASHMTIYKVENNVSTVIKTISFPFSQTGNYSKIDSIPMQRGKSYWFKVTTSGGDGFTILGQMKVKWPRLVYVGGGNITTLYGGCRIKQIISHDTASQDDLIKNYSYVNLQVKSQPRYFREVYKFWDPDPPGSNGNANNTPCNEYTVPGVLLTSNSIFNLGSGSHVGYDIVTESIGTGGGHTTFTFSNFDSDQVGVLDANWRRGRLLRQQEYISPGNPVRETRYYNKRITLPSERYAGHTARSSGKHPCSSEANAHLGSFPAFWSQEVYDFQVDWLYTDTIEVIDYVTGQTKIVANSYDNPQHMLPTRSTTVNSDGSKIINFTKYPTDFSLSGTMNSNETQALKLLQDKHIHTVPIERYVQKWPVGAANPLTAGAAYTEFKTLGAGNDMVVGNKDYSLDINQAVTNFQPMNVSGNIVNKDSRYSEKMFAKDYDPRNNLLTLRTEGENDFGYIWGYNNTLTIAKVANKMTDYLPAFTSFEKEAKGNWTYNDAGIVTSDALTGKQSFNLAYGGLAPTLYVETPANPGAPHQIIPGRFIVTYWKKNGTVLVNGSNPTLTGATANGWTYCEHTFVDPYNIMQISGTALIDELRFYTEGSLMESFTYNPLIGITSVNNAANHITLYEYDAMGRLTIERDVFRKIIKQHTYKYQVTE